MADPKIQIVLAVKDEATGGLKQVENQFVKSLGGMRTGADSFAMSFGSLRSTLAGIGVAVSVGGLAAFSKSVLDAGIEAEKLNRAFVAIAGSASGAKNELTFLKTESDRLGQNFYKVAAGYKGIFAGAKEANVSTSDLHDTFTGVTEALTVLGASSDDADRAFRAIGQSFGKGKVMAEEVRQQFGEVIPTAFAMMAKGMGVSTAQLDKMLQSGTVGLDAWSKMAKVMHEAYGPAVADAAKTAAAAVNKLDEAQTNLKMSLARLGGETAAKGMQAISSALNSVSTDIEKVEKAASRTDKWQRFMDGFKSAKDPNVLFFSNISEGIRRMSAELDKTSVGDFMSVETQATAANTKNLGDLVKNLTKEYQKMAQARSDVLGRGVEGKLADQEKALNTELQKGIQLREVMKGLDDERSNLFQGFDQSAQNLDELQSQLDEINAAISERRAGPSVGMFGDVAALTQQRDIVMSLIDDEKQQALAIEQQVALNEKLYQVKAEALKISEQQAQIKQGEEIQGLVSALQQRMETGSINDAETQRLITSILEKRTKLETDLNAKISERDDLMMRMTALSGMAGYDATADRERVYLLDQSIAKTREWVEGAKSSAQGVSEKMLGLNDALKQAADQNTAILDKQIADANARYGTVLDYIRTNPIVIDANIDPLRDKLQAVLSEIQRVQAQISGGWQGIRTDLQEIPSDWDFTVDVGMTKSPRKPWHVGYSELLQELNNLPRGSDYTFDMGSINKWDGMSRTPDTRDYNYVTGVDYSGADQSIVQALNNAVQGMTNEYARGPAVIGDANLMAQYYHDMIPKLEVLATISKAENTSTNASVSLGGVTINVQGNPNDDKDVRYWVDLLVSEVEARVNANRSGSIWTNILR